MEKAFGIAIDSLMDEVDKVFSETFDLEEVWDRLSSVLTEHGLIADKQECLIATSANDKYDVVVVTNIGFSINRYKWGWIVGGDNCYINGVERSAWYVCFRNRDGKIEFANCKNGV